MNENFENLKFLVSNYQPAPLTYKNHATHERQCREVLINTKSGSSKSGC
jgi:hypothetical protein